VLYQDNIRIANVRFWHKADTQLTNNSFQCWWAGATSIGRGYAPMLEVLCKPTLTLFVEKPFVFWGKKNPEEKSANVCFRPKANTQSIMRVY